MNLEYAAYLLNENYILNEDAGSEGQKGARKWFEKNKVNIEFGDDQGPNAMTPIQFQQKIQNEFAKPINVALVQNDKNVNKFLMGAGRIAVTECGWLTQKEDEKMIANLKLMYAYAYFEWKDGIAAGLPGPQRGQQYGGKYNKDFNGLSYQALYNEIGADNIAEAKRRLEAARNNPEAIAAAEEEERAAAAAREEEARRNSQAGEYHIEYIPDWETSHSWYEYTNPLSTDTGCHWCITQRQSFWDSYASDPGNTTYFCWKAPSKEALLAMNRDRRWFQDWPTDRESQEQAPMNEYGLSLICVQVRSDHNGNAELRCVTSRYNHRSPRNQSGPGPLYGDCLVTQGRRGLPKLCEILGITEEEFYQKFTIRSGTGRQIDHSGIPAALVQFRDARTQGNSQDTLIRILNRYCSDVTPIPNTNLVRIYHNGEFNIVTGTGLLLSPARWFQTIEIHKTANNNPYIFVKFKDNGVPVCNLLTSTGKFMLAKHVKSCVASLNYNYAKIGITVNGNTYFNIVNVNNGSLLLRKPARDVLLANNYYNNIPVLFDGSDNWQLVDLKGKNLKISAPIKKALSMSDMSEGYFQGKYLIAAKLNNDKLGVVNKTTGKIIYKLKANESFFGVGENVFTIKNSNLNKYYLYDNQGNLLVTNGRNSIHISYNPSKYVTYKSPSDGLHIYNTETKRDVRIPQEMRYFDSTNFSCKNLVLVGGLYTMIDDEILPGRLYSSNLVNFTTGPFNKYAAVTYPTGTRIINLETKETVVADIKMRDIPIAYNNYLYFKTHDNKLKVYNENFEIITELPQVDLVTPINYDCSLVKLITGDNAKYNIINSDGEMMFEHNFSDMLTAGFDENGVASIKAGRYEYFINTDGDVSSSLAFIAEKTQMKTDGPILMEYTSPLRKEF